MALLVVGMKRSYGPELGIIQEGVSFEFYC